VGRDEGSRVEAGVGRSDGCTVESDGLEVGHRDGDGDGSGDDWAVRVGGALGTQWLVGHVVGQRLGEPDGATDGRRDGEEDGFDEGSEVGGSEE
jgi:hypothetical protein